MNPQKLRRIVVSHQKGKRKRVYELDRFLRLQERFGQWVDYRLEPLAVAVEKTRARFVQRLAAEAKKTDFPSELRIYSNSIELNRILFQVAQAEFEWCKGLLGLC